MNYKLRVLLLLIIFAFSSTILSAREARVNQIPNGKVFSCLNCHVNANGEGALNSFGKTVNNGYLKNGVVTWGASLAAIDSDGDGFSNGTELNDPSGTWTQGAANPGNSSTLSNPGVKTSIPTSVFDNNSNDNIKIAKFRQDVKTGMIAFDLILQQEGILQILIYSVDGSLVAVPVNKFCTAGTNNFEWDGKSFLGLNISSSAYFMRIIMGNSCLVYKFIL
jgi:hypothetical protein